MTFFNKKKISSETIQNYGELLVEFSTKISKIIPMPVLFILFEKETVFKIYEKGININQGKGTIQQFYDWSNFKGYIPSLNKPYMTLKKSALSLTSSQLKVPSLYLVINNKDGLIIPVFEENKNKLLEIISKRLSLINDSVKSEYNVKF